LEQDIQIKPVIKTKTTLVRTFFNAETIEIAITANLRKYFVFPVFEIDSNEAIRI
jgi:hypothetical protein